MKSLAEKCGEMDQHYEDYGCESGDSFSVFGEEELRGRSSSTGGSSSFSESSKSRSSSGHEKASKEAWEPLEWPMRNGSDFPSVGSDKKIQQIEDANSEKPKQAKSDLEMMKERFAKLLLGEDISGCGKGVCSAMAISNAITNLCATIFGQHWRLEPLTDVNKSMWQKEMDFLLCVSDHIVEFKPSLQTFHDGRKLEVMSRKPRPDLFIYLPALRKLDNLLVEVLDSFKDEEFWYADSSMSSPKADGSVSLDQTVRHQEKWWLPTPRVPSGGLPEQTRKQLAHKRDCTSQILKAAMAINSNALAEMEVPESYIDSLPKNGRACLGEVMYRHITSENFFPETVLDRLDLSSEHRALEFANRVEAASHAWRRRAVTRTPYKAKSSWGMVKEIMSVDSDRRELLAGRAEALLHCLKQRFPCLSQTSLDMNKIQFNKDVGKSILEAYSRALESIASNIIARIDHLFHADDLVKNSENQLPSTRVRDIGIVSKKKKASSIPFPVPVSCTTKALDANNMSLSSPRLIRFSKKVHGRGLSVKKVLTDYLGVELSGKGTTTTIAVSVTGDPKKCMNR